MLEIGDWWPRLLPKPGQSKVTRPTSISKHCGIISKHRGGAAGVGGGSSGRGGRLNARCSKSGHTGTTPLDFPACAWCVCLNLQRWSCWRWSPGTLVRGGGPHARRSNIGLSRTTPLSSPRYLIHRLEFTEEELLETEAGTLVGQVARICAPLRDWAFRTIALKTTLLVYDTFARNSQRRSCWRWRRAIWSER